MCRVDTVGFWELMPDSIALHNSLLWKRKAHSLADRALDRLADCDSSLVERPLFVHLFSTSGVTRAIFDTNSMCINCTRVWCKFRLLKPLRLVCLSMPENTVCARYNEYCTLLYSIQTTRTIFGWQYFGKDMRSNVSILYLYVNNDYPCVL